MTGVRGVGKTTTARIIALSINCQKRKKNIYEPCGQCDSCKSIGVDSNLDVIEMDAASNTGVDDVREIIDNIKYKPILGKYKIFIIDEVHMLSKNAFNALLKTLEEPPEHVKFIFATTEVKKIPITVLSRCQRFDLLRINNQNLTNHLLKIIKLESIEIEMEAISLIVRASDGSIRDALSLLDQAISNQNEKINANTIVRMLGLAERDKIFDLIESILKGEDPQKRIFVGYEGKSKKKGDKVSRLSEIMADARMPWFCPKCKKVMKSKADDKMWRLFGHCLECQVEFEHELRTSGKYEDWENKKILENTHTLNINVLWY